MIGLSTTPTNPIRAIFPGYGCARTTAGHAAATLPKAATKSLLLMLSPGPKKQHSIHSSAHVDRGCTGFVVQLDIADGSFSTLMRQAECTVKVGCIPKAELKSECCLMTGVAVSIDLPP